MKPEPIYSQEALQRAIQHCLDVVAGADEGQPLALIDPRKLAVVLDYLLTKH